LLFESPVIAHSMEILWVVGYGVVMAPGVVRVWAVTRADPKKATNAVTIASVVSRIICLR
jgi:hypothetical protein